MENKNELEEKLNESFVEEEVEVDEDLEFLKNQIRHKKMIADKKKEDKTEEEDYSYIERFKKNSLIEKIAGVVIVIIGLITKSYITSCLGIIFFCFGYFFGKIAKYGEYKRDKGK